MKIKKIVVILGMHRSGTSVLSRSMKTLGFDYGDKHGPAGFDNPKGFFEDTDLVALNEAILHEIQHTWDSPLFLSNDHLKTINKIYFKKAKRLIDFKIKNGITCFKDPRITKLIKFWEPVFSSIDTDTYYLLSIRHPLSIAESLSKRNNTSFIHSSLMWTDYYISVLEIVDWKQLSIIDYDLFIKNPTKVLNRLSQAIKAKVNFEELELFKRDFLTNKLTHSSFKLSDMKNLKDFSLAKDIYSYLLKLAKEDSRYSAVNTDLFRSRLNNQTFYHDVVESYVRLQHENKIRLQYENKINDLYVHLDSLIKTNKILEQANLAMQNSFSWRVTKPLRLIYSLNKAVIKRFFERIKG